jgi:tRNA(fMet)-specific endonuclease VapC
MQRIARVGESAVCVNIVVACELRFGAAKKQSEALSRRVEQLLSAIPVLPLESGVDEEYAEIRRYLEMTGQPIGPNDLLIAAHARALGMVLVTDNVRKFERVPGLRVENWMQG